MSDVKRYYGYGVNDSESQIETQIVVDGKRMRGWMCPFYRAWTDMIKRCYSTKEHKRRPAYIGCTVAPEWHSFSTFRAWMSAQDYEGKQLDKDILLPGNKVYGPDTCVFVTSQVNSFLSDRRADRGDYPIGASLHKETGKFQANCKNPFTGKKEYLGLFAKPEAAHEAWRSRKHELACQYAVMQNDLRIAVALSTRYAPSIDAVLQAKL